MCPEDPTRLRDAVPEILRWLTPQRKPLCPNSQFGVRTCVPLGEPNSFFPMISSPVVDASAIRAPLRCSRIIAKKAKYFRVVPFSVTSPREWPAPDTAMREQIRTWRKVNRF